MVRSFFFNAPATTEIYTLSHHDALPIYGPDSFTYKANDGQADSPTNATVSITVTPVNDPPGTSGGIVADDSYSTPEDTTLTVHTPGVLSIDTDVYRDPLTAILVSSSAHRDHGAQLFF